jgi:hypothetical protein
MSMTSRHRKIASLVLAALLAGPVLHGGNGPSCRKKVVTAGILLGLASVGQTLAVAPAAPAPAPTSATRKDEPPPFSGLGLEPAASPGSLDQARQAYRRVTCPIVGQAEQRDPASHCRPGPVLGPGLGPEEADGLAMTMADPWVIEEEILGPAQRVVLDLEHCVCRALRQHEGSDAPDRDAVLFTRLRDTKEQHKALSQTLKDNSAVRKSLQNALKKDKSLWHDPAEYTYTADPGPVRHPGRVEMTLVAEEQMRAAKARYENTILPLLVDLKRAGRH